MTKNGREEERTCGTVDVSTNSDGFHTPNEEEAASDEFNYENENENGGDSQGVGRDILNSNSSVLNSNGVSRDDGPHDVDKTNEGENRRDNEKVRKREGEDEDSNSVYSVNLEDENKEKENSRKEKNSNDSGTFPSGTFPLFPLGADAVRIEEDSIRMCDDLDDVSTDSDPDNDQNDRQSDRQNLNQNQNNQNQNIGSAVAPEGSYWGSDRGRTGVTGDSGNRAHSYGPHVGNTLNSIESEREVGVTSVSRQNTGAEELRGRGKMGDATTDTSKGHGHGHGHADLVEGRDAVPRMLGWDTESSVPVPVAAALSVSADVHSHASSAFSSAVGSGHAIAPGTALVFLEERERVREIERERQLMQSGASGLGSGSGYDARKDDNSSKGNNNSINENNHGDDCAGKESGIENGRRHDSDISGMGTADDTSAPSTASLLERLHSPTVPAAPHSSKDLPLSSDCTADCPADAILMANVNFSSNPKELAPIATGAEKHVQAPPVRTNRIYHRESSVALAVKRKMPVNTSAPFQSRVSTPSPTVCVTDSVPPAATYDDSTDGGDNGGSNDGGDGAVPDKDILVSSVQVPSSTSIPSIVCRPPLPLSPSTSSSSASSPPRMTPFSSTSSHTAQVSLSTTVTSKSVHPSSFSFSSSSSLGHNSHNTETPVAVPMRDTFSSRSLFHPRQSNSIPESSSSTSVVPSFGSTAMMSSFSTISKTTPTCDTAPSSSSSSSLSSSIPSSSSSSNPFSSIPSSSSSYSSSSLFVAPLAIPPSQTLPASRTPLPPPPPLPSQPPPPPSQGSAVTSVRDAIATTVRDFRSRTVARDGSVSIEAGRSGSGSLCSPVTATTGDASSSQTGPAAGEGQDEEYCLVLDATKRSTAPSQNVDVLRERVSEAVDSVMSEADAAMWKNMYTMSVAANKVYLKGQLTGSWPSGIAPWAFREAIRTQCKVMYISGNSESKKRQQWDRVVKMLESQGHYKAHPSSSSSSSSVGKNCRVPLTAPRKPTAPSSQISWRCTLCKRIIPSRDIPCLGCGAVSLRQAPSSSSSSFSSSSSLPPSSTSNNNNNNDNDNNGSSNNNINNNSNNKRNGSDGCADCAALTHTCAACVRMRRNEVPRQTPAIPPATSTSTVPLTAAAAGTKTKMGAAKKTTAGAVSDSNPKASGVKGVTKKASLPPAPAPQKTPSASTSSSSSGPITKNVPAPQADDSRVVKKSTVAPVALVPMSSTATAAAASGVTSVTIASVSVNATSSASASANANASGNAKVVKVGALVPASFTLPPRSSGASVLIDLTSEDEVDILIPVTTRLSPVPAASSSSSSSSSFSGGNKTVSGGQKRNHSSAFNGTEAVRPNRPAVNPSPFIDVPTTSHRDAVLQYNSSALRLECQSRSSVPSSPLAKRKVASTADPLTPRIAKKAPAVPAVTDAHPVKDVLSTRSVPARSRAHSDSSWDSFNQLVVDDFSL